MHEVSLLSEKSTRKAAKTRRDKAKIEAELKSARRSAKAAQDRLKAYKEGLKDGLDYGKR